MAVVWWFVKVKPVHKKSWLIEMPLIRLIVALFFMLGAVLVTQVIHATDDNKVILMATTTSTENSGLLDYLLPFFAQDTGYSVRTIVAGTGKVLRMGQAGDVDVLLVHAKPSELAFVQAGYGVNRQRVMFNDFVVVGTADDPAAIGSASNMQAAFTRLASAPVLFVSRGDDSGTHKKELSIWQSVGTKPQAKWYREVGQGMGKTLQIADQLGAYTLTDRGTWIFAQDKLSMTIVFESAPQLNNQYSVITVNPERHKINYQGATVFSDWIASKKGQQLINSYRIKGEQLFYANAAENEN